jgi:hypothetical protein
MAFHYNKHKHEDQGHFWASYSDLLLGMSVVFLLLYVTASVRSGASGIQYQIQNQKLSREVEDLKNQLKAYEAIKQSYLKKEASPVEEQEYLELMDKLVLLQDEAQQEKNQLQKAVQDQVKKEKALNQYQQMIRNIINANTLAKSKISKRNRLIQEQESAISEKNTNIKKLHENLATRESHIEKLKADHAKQVAKDKALFESTLAQEKLGSEERAKKQALFKEQMEAKEQALGQKIAALSGQLEQTQGALNRMQAEIADRKKVAEDIRKAFSSQGIKAEVNGNGDVVLDFGEHHFASDSAKLGQGMIQILEKAMPTYAQSLFGNKKIADKVRSVEIIGFASPTYKGKFIDPKSDLNQDKEALAYNMDLSYRRAKSIYEYSFHSEKITFKHQKQMLPLVKVSARSYLELFDEKRRPADFQNYCQAHDCNKARKVMIKFTLDGKN